MAANEPPKPPYFLVFEASGGAENPLTIAAADRGAIPLFSSEHRARDFLSSTDFDSVLEPAQVSVERLVEILEAHRDLVEYVAHDPPPAGEGGAKVRMGKLADLSDSLKERARNSAGLFDIGRPDLN
ncbi:hypothetical protein BH20ACT11_BH20ACT11_03420 [soil metagenome]|jgi:hypothetical protein